MSFALLADGRFPSGGHAHSSGYEVASAAFDLTSPSALGAFIEGRLTTSGVTDAGLIVAVFHRLDGESIDWLEIDAEVSARIASPALRQASRALGRQWLRAAREIWPSPVLDHLAASSPDGPHHVAALAVTTWLAGLTPAEAATLHLHHLLSGIVTAAIRLHGLDPYAMQRTMVRQADLVESIVNDALGTGGRSLASLPAPSGLLTEVLAEEHRQWDVRMFQS